MLTSELTIKVKCYPLLKNQIRIVLHLAFDICNLDFLCCKWLYYACPYSNDNAYHIFRMQHTSHSIKHYLSTTWNRIHLKWTHLFKGDTNVLPREITRKHFKHPFKTSANCHLSRLSRKRVFRPDMCGQFSFR